MESAEATGKTLMVVDGPSAAGKSYLLRWASERFDGVVAVPKLTTRPPRRGEDAPGWSDLIHVPAAEFGRHPLDWVYDWNGHRYGLSLSHLRSKLAAAQLGLLVVRHEPTIRRLLRELSDLRVVPVWVDAGADVRRARLLADGWSAGQADRLLAAEPPTPAADLYRRRILNDGSLDDFRRRIAELIAGHGGLYGERDR